MMRKVAIAAFLFVIAPQVHAYEYWNDIRYSALLPDGFVTVRMENPSGAGAENWLLYADSVIQEESMAPLLDGPSTLAAIVPGPAADPRFYGFRFIQGSELDLMPVRIPEGVSPMPQDLTRLAEDAAGDHLFGYTNLDLVDCRVSFSETKLFAALQNAGGGFPVSQGLTFFGYLLAIAGPAMVDPDTVFALMQTYNQPGIISPGLYKITGTGFGDLIKIGNVSVQEYPASNSLVLSCDLADLMADPYFQSWYATEDPRMGVAGFTQRITLLGGADEADRSPGGRCYLREFSIVPGDNVLPVLANLTIEGTGAEAFARIEYWDADGNCPVIAEIAFDGGMPFPMYPLTLDYGSPVAYTTGAGIEPLANDSWTSAVARFSDNAADTTEIEIAATAVGNDDMPAPRDVLRLSVAPNPFNATATIEFTMPEHGHARVSIFDPRGGHVRTLIDDVMPAGLQKLTWDGRSWRESLAASGVYFCTVAACGDSRTIKLLLIR